MDPVPGYVISGARRRNSVRKNHMKTRLPLVAAMVAMTATPLAAFDLSQMTEEERMIFRSEVRNYLMDNPEVLLEAINVTRSRANPAATA